LQGLEDAIRSRLVMATGQHRLVAMSAHAAADLVAVGGHDDAAEPAFNRPRRDMGDHRLTGDVGERLSRQAGGAHAGWYENDNRHLGREKWQKVSHGIALICVARP
jgi:hypothetical protein